MTIERKPLYKTTIVIYSTTNPEGKMEIDTLAEEAMRGSAYCTEETTETITDPFQIPESVVSFFHFELGLPENSDG